MTKKPQSKYCFVLAMNLFLSCAHAVDYKTELLCYIQSGDSTAAPKLVSSGRKMFGTFYTLTAPDGQITQTFIPLQLSNEGGFARSSFYEEVRKACVSSAHNLQSRVRGYAAVGFNGATTQISDQASSLEDIISNPAHKAKAAEIVSVLSMRSSTVISNETLHAMTDKEFFADYSERTFNNVVVELKAESSIRERLSQIVEPLAMTRPTREELKRRLTTYIYGNLPNLHNRSKAAQAAASFVIAYSRPLGDILASAAESTFYIQRLDEATAREQTFTITQDPSEKDEIKVTAEAQVTYPGYVLATGQHLSKPFKVKYMIPFIISYSDYKNNDYEQVLQVYYKSGLFEQIALEADQSVKDDIFGAWIDGQLYQGSRGGLGYAADKTTLWKTRVIARE